MRLLKSLSLGLLLAAGISAVSFAATVSPPGPVYDTPSDINCATDLVCSQHTDITVKAVTLGATIGSANYHWDGASTCTNDSVFCIIPTGATHAYVMDSNTAFGNTYTPTASIAALQAYGAASASLKHATVSDAQGMGMPFDWVAGDESAVCPDSGTWYTATGIASTAGCWHRIYSGELHAMWFTGADNGYNGSTNTADSTAAFTAIGNKLAASARSGPQTNSRYLVTGSEYVSSGDYLITAADGSAFGGTPAQGTWGFKLTGDGRGSNIYYNPTGGSGLLMKLNNWAGGSVRDMTFTSANATNNFLQFSATGSQWWEFRNLLFGGPWNNIFQLIGTDQSSDLTIDHVEVWGGYNGAFLYTPCSGGTVQAKNYYIENSQFTYLSNWGPIVDFCIGGNINIINDNATTANQTLFYLRESAFIDTYTHGDFNFSVRNFELEPLGAATNLVVINSVWPTGNISFDNFDAGQTLLETALNQVMWNFTLTNGGPTISIRNSQVPGVALYTAPPNPQHYSYSITYENDIFLQQTDIFKYGSPSIQIAHDATDSTNLAGLPVVRMRNCKGGTGNASTNSYYLRAAYPTSTVVSVGQFYVLSDMVWKVSSVSGSATTSATVPYPTRAFTYNDPSGNVVWQSQDSFSDGVYATDANVKYDGIPAPEANLDELKITLSTPVGGLPTGAAGSMNYAFKILPPNHWVIAAELVIPPGASAMTGTVVYDLKDEEWTAVLLHSFSVVNPSIGYDSGRVTIFANAAGQAGGFSTGPVSQAVTSAFGKRIISINAEASATAAIPGAYVILWYI